MIDCHVHYAAGLDERRLNQVIEKFGIEQMVLLCIPQGDGRPTEPAALAYQKASPIPIRVMGGLPREIYQLDETTLSKQLMVEARRLLDMGCVGIKMLEGKPNVRKEVPIPDFDSSVWEGFWTEMEQEQIPIVFHVNDPEEFWDAEKVTEAAKQFGWFYDETFVNNEEQYRQVLTVLERHPKLRILFPHFFFMSGQLERLSRILDCYDNVRIDLTPGVELYYNLSANHKKATEFFCRYQNRICYGTDIGGRQVILKKDTPLSIEESEGRVSLIRDFLETEGTYTLNPDGYYVKSEPKQMHGLGLSEEIKKQIYGDNILRFLNGD